MIFVDTSFWAGLRGRRDQRHAEATSLWSRYGSEPLITSRAVRGETWTLLRRRVGFHAAVNFINVLEQSQRVIVATITDDLESDALTWLRRHDEREYSYVDATSFALMRSLNIYQALAFDGDFSAAGFVELRL